MKICGKLFNGNRFYPLPFDEAKLQTKSILILLCVDIAHTIKREC